MVTENPYIKQFPDLMAGKTVLYVHGFASSGQSGTVRRLQEVLPEARVIAPDLPIHPHEALALLHDICLKEKPDLIVGTSMGGMFAEQLRGYDRICVNPALDIGETMRAHGLTGTQQFQNPRQDGAQEFYVDKALVKEYREVSEQRFQNMTDDDCQRVYGLFGDEDELVDTYDIDDRQQQRERPIIYIGIETMMDSYRKPVSSVQKAVRQLIERYQVLFVAPAEDTATTDSWLTEHIGVPAWRHTVYTYRRDLLYGDYLIAAPKQGRSEGALTTVLEYGSETFKTWEDIIEYFSRLGGQ